MINTKSPCISVIIPIYNAEKYIAYCIESVLNQTFRDFELILVNDGSLDSSTSICDDYASRDNRIHVIHQLNAGVTAARRVGVSKSTSDWVCFVDADDTLPLTTLCDFWKEALTGKYDIICGRYDDKNSYKEQFLTPVHYRKTLLKAKDIHIAPWGRLIAKKLFTDNVMDIPRKITRGEDFLMNIRLSFVNNKPVRLLNKKVYNYLPNPTSCTTNFKVAIEYESFYFEFLKKSVPEFCLEEYKNNILSVALLGIEQIADRSSSNTWLDTEYFQKILHEIDVEQYPLSKLRRCRLLESNPLRLRLYTFVLKLIRKLGL